MQQARHAAIQRIQFRGDDVGRLVAAYPLLQPKVLNHARDHGSRLQACAGIVEEGCLLAACGLRSQPFDVLVLHGSLDFAWHLPILPETLYC